jgi:hypothetical protein
MNKITAGVLAASAAALVVSGCYYTTSGRPVPNPASARTTAATTAVAAPSTSALPTKPPLQPGPHSWIADVDLPEGTEECSSSMCSRDNTSYRRDNHWEFWRYSAPYDDTIAFLRDRVATGRQYDAHGATWWSGLPPCYNAIHQSPPWGWTDVDDGTHWLWTDGARWLLVVVYKPPVKLAGTGEIVPSGVVSIAQGSSLNLGCLRA